MHRRLKSRLDPRQWGLPGLLCAPGFLPSNSQPRCCGLRVLTPSRPLNKIPSLAFPLHYHGWLGNHCWAEVNPLCWSHKGLGCVGSGDPRHSGFEAASGIKAQFFRSLGLRTWGCAMWESDREPWEQPFSSQPPYPELGLFWRFGNP